MTITGDSPLVKNYKSGIVDSRDCGTMINQHMNAVGYGTENGKEYYILKSFWTTNWGEKGYIRISTADPSGPGICGIHQVTYFAS